MYGSLIEDHIKLICRHEENLRNATRPQWVTWAIMCNKCEGFVYPHADIQDRKTSMGYVINMSSSVIIKHVQMHNLYMTQWKIKKNKMMQSILFRSMNQEWSFLKHALYLEWINFKKKKINELFSKETKYTKWCTCSIDYCKWRTEIQMT